MLLRICKGLILKKKKPTKQKQKPTQAEYQASQSSWAGEPWDQWTALSWEMRWTATEEDTDPVLSPLAYVCAHTHTHTRIPSYEVVLLYSTSGRKIIFCLCKTLRTLKWQRGIQVQDFLPWEAGPLHLIRALVQVLCVWEVHMRMCVHTCICIWVPDLSVEVREKCWMLLNHHSLCFWKHGLSVGPGPT